MKKLSTVLVVVLALALGGAASAEMAKGGLDGKTFSGKIGPKTGKGKKFDDDLVFKDGTFTSTACQSMGFGSAPYMSEMKDGKMMFEATTTNDKGEKMMWHGMIMGNKVSATANKMGTDGKSEMMMYKGMMAKK
jgi:hypothetical protein